MSRSTCAAVLCLCLVLASQFSESSAAEALDVALQHHEFGVVEDFVEFLNGQTFIRAQDLMMVLMEQKHSAEYGHAWDQFGENTEILGRALPSTLSGASLSAVATACDC